MRCYHCGQSAVHLQCLGNNIAPEFDFVCRDCNDVVGAVVKTSNVVSPERFDNRYRQHKRLLAQLTKKEDPVLLSSPVFATMLWKKWFGVKECKVVVTPLSQQLLSRMYRRRISMKRLKLEFGKSVLYIYTLSYSYNLIAYIF